MRIAPNPHGLAMAPDGSRVLVSAWGANEAQFIDTATDRIVARAAAGRRHNGAISADGRTAWVGSQRQGATALVPASTVAERRRRRAFRSTVRPRALDLSPDGRRLYFTVAQAPRGAGARYRHETAGRRTEIAVGASPHQAPLTADGKWALVPSQGPGELGVIDTSTGARGSDSSPSARRRTG